MIKHNCGGQGLTDGLRDRVQQLVEVLQRADQLHIVRVHLEDHNRDPERAQTVLRPLSALQNFDAGGGLMLTGDVTEKFVRHLAQCSGVRLV